MRTWVIPFVLLTLAQSAEALCLGRVNLAGDDPPYRFAATYIDALSYGKQAGQRMTLVARDDVRNESVFASATRALTELELPAQDFECAASFMSSQESYPSETSSDIAAQGSRVARLAAGVVKQASVWRTERGKQLCTPSRR